MEPSVAIKSNNCLEDSTSEDKSVWSIAAERLSWEISLIGRTNWIDPPKDSVLYAEILKFE